MKVKYPIHQEDQVDQVGLVDLDVHTILIGNVEGLDTDAEIQVQRIIVLERELEAIQVIVFPAVVVWVQQS